MPASFNRKHARPRPMTLYFFTHDDEDKTKVLSRSTFGNVTINGTFSHIAQDDLSFGGVGESGMGAYHGIEGFEHSVMQKEFTNREAGMAWIFYMLLSIKIRIALLTSFFVNSLTLRIIK